MTEKKPATRRKKASAAEKPVKRAVPSKPTWLRSNKAAKRKGFNRMMANWEEFCKVPLRYLTEEECQQLLEAELNGKKRRTIAVRLHSAYNSKRVARERKDVVRDCMA